MLGCLPLFLVLLLLAPLFLLLTYFNAITLSFHRLGLSTEGAMLLFAASLIGGMINLPISRRPILVPEQRGWGFLGYFFYYPPRVQEQVIAINVGGAVIPLLFSLYLLPRAPLVPTALTGAIVAAVCKAIARPVPNVGIAMPAFIPPLVAVAAALAFAPGQAAPVAYIGGTLGTLIGADLLNLLGVRRMPALMLSIGGAGVFDGVFLVGILSALLT